MPEQLGEVAGRFVWGTPNLDEAGRLIGPSTCGSCVQWSITGWFRRTDEYAGGCLLHYGDTPRTQCARYAREPGSDDE